MGNLLGGDEFDVRYTDVVMEWVLYQENTTDVNFQKPFIRKSLKYLYPLYIFLYSAIFAFGTFGNVCIIGEIMRKGLYKNPMYLFLGNLAFSDLFIVIIVLPLTLANLLIQNWIFGSLLCFLLPMMHFLPIHASMTTHLMIAVDRYRYIVHPMKSRVPSGLCLIAVWVIAICAVLPYPLYIKYIDLETAFGPVFEGVGICYLNIDRDVQQYHRTIFVTSYCLPLGVIASLFIKVSTEIKYFLSDKAPIRIDYAENLTQEGISYSQVTWLSRDGRPTRTDARASTNKTSSRSDTNDYTSDEMDAAKEKRIQNHLIAMVILFAVCWLPINILLIVTHFVFETSENSDHYDITYITLVFFGFLSTCVNPILFASLRLKRKAREMLCRYIPFPTGSSLIVENLSTYSGRKSPMTEIETEQ